MAQTVFKRPESLTGVDYTYCPGCGHGIITTAVAKAIDELGILDDSIHVSSVGCGGLTPMFFNSDTIIPMHGRAPATATGIKRIHPDKIVWTYQGDGDLASIGTAEIVHAAHRGERITTIGGMVGRIVQVNDTTVVFETSEDRVRVEITKWGIQSTESMEAAAQKSSKKSKKGEEKKEEAPAVEAEQPKVVEAPVEKENKSSYDPEIK